MARKTQRNPVDAQITQVKLRLRKSTRLMLLAHAVRNNRSLNSEIVHRLDASLAEDSGTLMIARAIVRDLDPTLLDAIAKEHHDNAARAKGATRGVKQPSGFSVAVARLADEPVLRKLPRMIASYEEGARNEKDPRKRETLWHVIKTLRNIEDGGESILHVLPRTIASYEQQALTEKDPRKLETILDVIESLKNIERDWKVQKAARRLQSAEK